MTKRTARQNYDSLVNPIYRSSHPGNDHDLFKLVLDSQGLRAYNLRTQESSMPTPIDDLAWLEQVDEHSLTPHEKIMLHRFQTRQPSSAQTQPSCTRGAETSRLPTVRLAVAIAKHYGVKL